MVRRLSMLLSGPSHPDVCARVCARLGIRSVKQCYVRAGLRTSPAAVSALMLSACPLSSVAMVATTGT